MNEFDEIPEAVEILTGIVRGLAFDALAGSDKAFADIQAMISFAVSRDMPPRGRGRGPRGMGYDFDDAQIVASLDDYGGSLEKAVRAHWQRDEDEWLDEDQIEAIIKRINRHKKEVEAFGMPDHI